MKNLNFAGKIAQFFVKNKPLSVMILLSVFVIGSFAYYIMPKQYNPDVSLPAFQIQIAYNGASRDEVENFITHELEEKISDIKGVNKISTISIDGGIAILNVEFFVGTDLGDAKIKVASKIIENIDLKLPQMSQPVIKNINPDDVPILTIGFTSEFLSKGELRTKVVDIMSKMRDVKGVANLEIHGGDRRAMRVVIDPFLLKERQMSVDEVQNAILANNFKVNVGNIKNDTYIHEIEINGNLNKNELENLFVKKGIKLKEIADVIDGHEEVDSYTRIYDDFGVRDAVFLSVAKKKGENAIKISEKFLARLGEEMESCSDVSYKVYRDEGKVTERAVSTLGQNLISSILIVALLLFAFLGFKSSLLASMSIPTTLLLVFFVGLLFDQTINRITLFALILSLGLLVDSATVVIENIMRHIKNTNTLEDRQNAIIKAVDEVGVGLFLSTLTSVIVFLPLSQVSGMMGNYMKPLSFFVPVTLIMSILVAYVIIPFLASIFIKQPAIEKKGVFEKISEYYGKILTRILNSKARQYSILSFVAVVFIFVMLFPVFKFVHFKMLPSADKEQYYVYLDLEEGIDFKKTSEISSYISQQILKNDKNVVSIQEFSATPSVVDFNGLYKGSNLRNASNLATIRVNLTLPKERNAWSSDLVADMREVILADQKIQSFINNYGLVVRFFEDPPGPPVRATLLAKIKTQDDDLRADLASELEQKFKSTKGVKDVKNTTEKVFFRTIYEVDHEKAVSFGVSTNQIVSLLNTALNANQISQYHIQDHNEPTFIELSFEKEYRDQIQDLDSLYVKNQQGEMLVLSSVVKKIQTRNVPVLYRDELEATTYVEAEMENRSVVYAVIDLISDYVKSGQVESWNLFKMRLKNGSKIEWGGEWKMTLENFRDLSLAMLVAFFLIYVVLVGQFGSFLAPLLIMSTILLGFIGIMPGFAFLDLLNGTFLNATSLIGFIALMGIVVNNAILYMEYFEQLRSDGMPKRSALIEAGKVRLRPIVLTSITTVLGSLTIAFDPVWSGLAWSIVFGLSLSAFLTLGVFPILYNLFIKK